MQSQMPGGPNILAFLISQVEVVNGNDPSVFIYYFICGFNGLAEVQEW
jgi:hypothetical protein